MARGGTRDGAGRKPGVPNRATAAKAAEIAETGETPLDYMLRIMRDPSVDHDRRDKMSVAAGPYVHAKLAAMEVTGKDGGPLQVNIVRFSDADDRPAG